jgi:hypothetical protein
MYIKKCLQIKLIMKLLSLEILDVSGFEQKNDFLIDTQNYIINDELNEIQLNGLLLLNKMPDNDFLNLYSLLSINGDIS